MCVGRLRSGATRDPVKRLGLIHKAEYDEVMRGRCEEEKKGAAGARRRPLTESLGGGRNNPGTESVAAFLIHVRLVSVRMSE